MLLYLQWLAKVAVKFKTNLKMSVYIEVTSTANVYVCVRYELPLNI